MNVISCELTKTGHIQVLATLDTPAQINDRHNQVLAHSVLLLVNAAADF